MTAGGYAAGQSAVLVIRSHAVLAHFGFSTGIARS